MIEGDRTQYVIGGHMLRALADLLHIRVTDWKRTPAQNKATTSASPTSLHLVGGAVDMGIETSQAKRDVLTALGYTVELHEKGTARHYHVYGGWKAVILVGSSTAVLTGMLAKAVHA